jgi:hypothetical protein
MQSAVLILDDSPFAPLVSNGRAPARDKLFAYIGGEVAAGKPFPGLPDLKTHMGWTQSQRVVSVLNALRVHGLLERYFVSGPRIRYAWALTDKGLEKWRDVCGSPVRGPRLEAGESVAAAGSPAKRKPRRTGAPKRVPHKPTTPHRKPSRQQRRESDRRREHQDRAPL